MASITNESGGRKTIQVVGLDGKRRSIRLGKVSRRHAELVRTRIEDIVACTKTGQPIPADVKSWLDSLDDALHARLAIAGLANKRTRTTLDAFLSDYIAGRTDTKHSTRLIYQRTRHHLCEHFGAETPLRSLTPADADGFAIALRQKGLSIATARRTIGLCKQFFRAAERAGIISNNPFTDLPAAVPANPAKAYFVTRDEIDRILAASNDNEWRLLIALARYGALRTPSEPLGMNWGDIDFEHGRLRVKSPKTEHHPDGGQRLMPLFPELRAHLLAARPADVRPEAPVITRYRMSNVNLRTRLLRDISTVGLKPWPRLWQNMRATRETELVEQFPAHVVAAWVGHTVAIAEKHYLQVTEDHFEQAVQNPVQSAPESRRTVSQSLFAKACNTR